ncbi:hypothetical protein [Roseitranquillus sediminis]|uniref:hypothetical protein n=1 Tax=Roseitranquillus sediminis TaxID=2809051 RepID=UPI001D0C9D41|nr:hypothetical protein [Roseitranquillus sediminis]MBM9596066.1 hypothetical protein [Roseitranquillus sediminis]
MTRAEEDDDILAPFFAAGRDGPRPPETLYNLVAADAEALRPLPSPPRRQTSPLRAFIDALGGWPALAGLTTAAAAGVWIGAAAPDAVRQVAGIDAAAGYELADLMPGYLSEEF